MSWALGLIAAGALVWILVEFKTIRKRQLSKQIESQWPQFEEIYISALESGASIPEAFSYVQDFELGSLQVLIDSLVAELDRGISFQNAIRKFGTSIDLRCADLFVEIVELVHRTGSQNVVAALKEHVVAVRLANTSKGDIAARNSAILTVAKLGLLAPWALLAVLAVNERNRESYSSLSGNLLMLGGFAISFLAFRLVVFAGQLRELPRVFGAR